VNVARSDRLKVFAKILKPPPNSWRQKEDTKSHSQDPHDTHFCVQGGGGENCDNYRRKRTQFSLPGARGFSIPVLACHLIRETPHQDNWSTGYFTSGSHSDVIMGNGRGRVQLLQTPAQEPQIPDENRTVKETAFHCAHQNRQAVLSTHIQYDAFVS
jgi:hypothetical protein